MNIEINILNPVDCSKIERCAMSCCFSKFGEHKRHIEWLPILVTRLFLGIFFILSGFYKLFDPKQHQELLNTIKSAHIPFPELSAYLVPFFECVCGFLILIGLLATLASSILFIIMIVALITNRIASLAAYKGVVFIENFLYLPEVLYALLLFWLIISGPGRFSIDYIFGTKKNRET